MKIKAAVSLVQDDPLVMKTVNLDDHLNGHEVLIKTVGSGIDEFIPPDYVVVSYASCGT